MPTLSVEYRERNSFNFYFRPIDKRVMASITMNAMYEGIKLWDKDVVRYLNSDHVPVYHPVEEFLYDLPHWTVKTTSVTWLKEFLVIILIGDNFFVVGFSVQWRTGVELTKIMRTVLHLF